MRDDEHDLNHFDYGAIEVRSFEGGPVLTRAAEIIWWEFDGNPGVFATLVRSVQPIERFLADGADVKGFEAGAVALRAHLLALRRPGVTARVEVHTTFRAPDDRFAFVHHAVRVGDEPRPLSCPGPDSAGSYGWPATDARSPASRLLTRAGRADGALHLAVRGPDPSDPRSSHIVDAKLPFTIDAGAVLVDVSVDCDTAAWPSLRLERR
jgi:hypothetical protein